MRPISARAAPTPRLHVALHATAGAVLLVASVALARLNPSWSALQPVLAGSGAVLVLLGLLHRPRHLAIISARICLMVLVLAVTLAGLEGLGRGLGFDFHRTEARLRRVPPFYRQPTIPTGTVFFRRPGPEVWHGQVIATYLRHLGLPVDDYLTEPAITVRYDTWGFRNENPARPWSVVVAGDSFVELGHLPHEALFTTLLGATLEQPVLNLGVSHTGPWTHLHYLETYGLRPGVQHAVMVFYEGNDLEDLDREDGCLADYARSGQRPTLKPTVETSLLSALGTWIVNPELSGPLKPGAKTALFRSADGERWVTLGGQPPARGQFGTNRQRVFEAVLARLAALARQANVHAWIAYMPCKERVFQGLLRDPHPGAPLHLAAWTSSDLPSVIGQLCAAHDVGFIDLTPDLVAHTQAHRQMTFNALYDSHLNAQGAAIVANTLARCLAIASP